MIKQAYGSDEIDIDTGFVEETFESRLFEVVNRVRGMKNPYVGNKRKILPWIITSLRDEGVEYNSVLDLFAGSHCFSIVMKLLGKKVFCNDLLLSSYHYGVGFVENNEIYISDDIANRLISPVNIELSVSSGWDRYFTKEEQHLIDLFFYNAKKIVNEEHGLKRIYLCSLIWANFQSYVMDRCYVGGRLNRGQILAELYHRIQHSRNLGSQMTFKNIQWNEFNSSMLSEQSLAFSLDAIDLLSNKSILNKDVDLVYIDPPYGGQQSDYYHMFNFFEHVASFWYDICDIKDVSKERFVSSSHYKDNFLLLLECLKNRDIPTWAISYNNRSWAKIDSIFNLLRKIVPDKNVIVKENTYEYNYAGKEKRKGKEFLIIVR